MSEYAVMTALRMSRAFENGHTILRSSGLHTDQRIMAGRLVEGGQSLVVVRRCVAEGLATMDAKLAVSVPKQASEILRYDHDIPVVHPVKLGRRQFELLEDDADRIRAEQNIAVVAGVVTTGGTSAAVANLVREVNPDARVSLLGICLRGEVEQEHAAAFDEARFLLRMPIPAWPAEECQPCNPQAGA